MRQRLAEHRDSLLWSAVESILAELKATGEISVNTAPGYVIAFVCRELVAKKLVTELALQDYREAEGS